MGSRLRCAVVGVGHLGKFHAQKYKALSNVDLVGVCDIHSETAQKVAADLGVPALHSYQDLLGKVDAVTIAASTTAHFELAKVFLEHGIHVHVEKPLTTTSTEGAELVKIARARNLRLQVGHVERFNPALIAARAQLQRPLFIECHRLSPFKQRSVDVDVVLDLMIHDLDVILSLVRSEPVSFGSRNTRIDQMHRYGQCANRVCLRDYRECDGLTSFTEITTEVSSVSKFAISIDRFRFWRSEPFD